jgi:hypothetical protein
MCSLGNMSQAMKAFMPSSGGATSNATSTGGSKTRGDARPLSDRTHQRANHELF